MYLREIRGILPLVLVGASGVPVFVMLAIIRDILKESAQTDRGPRRFASRKRALSKHVSF